MTYKEDDLTKGLIIHYQAHEFVEIIEPEAHYDHFGKRGWPDLYIVFDRPVEGLTEHHLIEVKSEHAIRQATGANEIIRQFNQMRWYFYEDDRRPVFPLYDSKEVVLVFELAFIPTEYTILHLFDNREMYNEAISSGSLDVWDKLPSGQSNRGIHSGIEVSLTLRHPAEPYPSRALITNGGRRLSPDDDPKKLIEEYADRFNGVE